MKFLLKLKKTATKTFSLLHEAHGEDAPTELLCLNGTRNFQKE
jgi:hypothetical protein